MQSRSAAESERSFCDSMNPLIGSKPNVRRAMGAKSSACGLVAAVSLWLDGVGSIEPLCAMPV